MPAELPKFDAMLEPIDTVKFFSQCVRINKPCLIDRLASNWRAKEYWRTGGEAKNSLGEIIGLEYLKNLIGHKQVVRTYFTTDAEQQTIYNKNEAFSFKFGRHQDMAYENFVDKMTKEKTVGSYSIKEDRRWETDGP